MKRIAVICLALTMFVGCAKAPAGTPPPPPPIGSLNAFDADTNKTLEAAHALVSRMVADNNSGKFVLTASQKALLNNAVDDLNTADLAYQAWHAAGAQASGQASVQAAVAKVQADQTSLNAVVGGK